MNEPIKIRKIYKKYQVEIHPFTGMFYVKIGDKEFRDSQFNLLLKMIEMSNLIIINEDVYYKTTMGFEKKKVVRLEYFDRYFYDEDGRQNNLEDCYPLTEHNRKVMNESEKIKQKGWDMIHNADVMLKEGLQPFGDKYWEHVMDRKVKENQSLSEGTASK